MLVAASVRSLRAVRSRTEHPSRPDHEAVDTGRATMSELTRATTTNPTTAFLAASLLATAPAAAAVTFVFDQAQFEAMADTVLVADFEQFADGDVGGNVVSLPAVSFFARPTGGPPAIISPTFSGGTAIDVPSKMLTANGNEHFDIALHVAAPTFAVGFDFITNGFEPAVFTVSGGLGNGVLGTLVVPLAPNSLGFIGIISTEAIGSIEWLADRGEISNTAIDNVRITVPTPAAALALAAATTLAASRRRRA